MNNIKAKKYARRAAISAVVCRNLAHNTGSHKAPWLKFFINDRFERLQDYLENDDVKKLPNEYKNFILANKDLQDVITDLPDREDKISESEKKRDKTKEKFFKTNKELLYYFDFFNSNMEFIADVTTMFDRERSSLELSSQDLIAEFIDKSFMQSGLVDDYYYLNGHDAPQIKIGFNSNGQRSDELKVDIPNGLLGQVAFLIIVENFIRNFYKHSEIVSGITLYYKFSVYNDDYISCDIFDMNSTSNQQRSSELLKNLNNIITSPIIKEDFSIRQEGWGLFEMKICAAYLVDFPLDFIDESINKDGFVETPKGTFLPLLTANYYGLEDNNFNINPNDRNLGYRFYLKRPKKIYIDESIYDDLIDINTDDLNKAGIVFGKVDLSKKSVYDSYALLISLEKNKEYIDPNQRVLFVDQIEFEYTNIQGEQFRYSFKDWIKVILNGLGLNNTNVAKIWEKYLTQQNYQIKDFKVFKNEDDLKDYAIVRNEDEFKDVIAKNAISDEFGNKKTPIYPKNMVIVDSHSKDVKSIGNKDLNNLKSYLFYISEDNLTQNWISSTLPYFQQVNRKEEQYFTEILNIDVVIFDERVQQEMQFKYRNNNNLTISDLLELNNIFIPSYQEINLSKITKSDVNKLEVMLKSSLEKNQYTIMHYTIFERIATRFKGYENNVEGLTKYYKELVQGIPNFLVFCSGRGRPANLIDNCYYIHLSSLRYILNSRSKFQLIQLLKSLRKTSNNG